MVPCRRGAEGYQSTRGEALSVAKHWSVNLFIFCFPLYKLGLGWARCSAHGDRLHLGALLFGYHARQLFARSGQCQCLCRSRLGSHASCDPLGELLRWLNWPRAARAYRPVSFCSPTLFF